MNMSEPIRFQKLRGELRRDEPMGRHVSWRTGGTAERFYAPADMPDLAAFLRQLVDLLAQQELVGHHAAPEDDEEGGPEELPEQGRSEGGRDRDRRPRVAR